MSNDDWRARRARARFRQYDDHALQIAVATLAGWRDHADTEQEGDRWQALLLAACEERDVRAAELREELDWVTAYGELMDET